MRQRKIKNLSEKLDHFSDYIIENPRECKGNWKQRFEKESPLYLEIGCGKGQFITRCAQAYPERNFIAVEGQQSVVLRALEKAQAHGLTNVCFITDYIDDVRDLFADGELAGIYLNFSDPWPKDRHAKRRLTCGRRLLQYCQVVEKDGYICFKTDNDRLFAYTLEQIAELGLAVAELSRDLHRSDFAAGNITTEYEDKFSQSGKNINYVKIRA